jgi:hypothetical protein
MKTQIIALEAHDDLISVRDRMSWAKSPRILLVWPKYEKIVLRAADLRILQQHASNLGAELGVITRRGDVRRDALQFGIPVFRSAAAAQRQKWPKAKPSAISMLHRPRHPRAELEAMRDSARPRDAGWIHRPLARIGFFALGVLAVLVIAGVFVPQATITVTPVSQVQDITVPITASKAVQAVSLAGGLPAHEITVKVSGSQSARVATRSSIPDRQARGIARFTNLSQSNLTIPAGTIVYSLAPAAVHFATLNETHLPGNVNAVVEVPIVAVNGGAEANLPANAIEAIQGSLSLSAAVVNPQPTTGGTDRVTAAPSDADRQRLHNVLLDQLKSQAAKQIGDSIGEKDLPLPGTLKLEQIAEETYDPPPGKPGNLLKLTLRGGFSEQYVLADDITQLMEATLDGSKPPEYLPLPKTVTAALAGPPSTDGAGTSHFKMQITRKLVKDIDLGHAAAMVTGKTPGAAAKLLRQNLTLAAAPEIKLFPPWWPWMPMIPFRVTVTAKQ